jgi:chromosome segregation ATPase
MTTEEPQRELADASQVIAALTIKLDRANETIEGLEATIESLRHERDRERRAHEKSWDALSARIARLEEVLSNLVAMDKECDQLREIGDSDFAYRAFVKGKTPTWNEARNVLEAKP